MKKKPKLSFLLVLFFFVSMIHRVKGRVCIYVHQNSIL